jgi:hypothetical protein
MRKKIKVVIIGLLLAFVLSAGSLIILVMNPTLLYSRESSYKNYTIYHNQPISLWLIIRLDRATNLLESSEIYDPDLNYSICLNDGSAYPKLIKAIQGEAFGWGFYHHVVLYGNSNFEKNFTELQSRKWNLTQLLAHEEMHCQQFNTFGFLKSNPVAKIPNWKWEGYPEYIARKKPDQIDLALNIAGLLSTEKTINKGWISFADGTGTSLNYYKNWLLVQFCMDIKRMTFVQMIHNRQSESELSKEMMEWYNLQNEELDSISKKPEQTNKNN